MPSHQHWQAHGGLLKLKVWDKACKISNVLDNIHSEKSRGWYTEGKSGCCRTFVRQDKHWCASMQESRVRALQSPSGELVPRSSGPWLWVLRDLLQVAIKCLRLGKESCRQNLYQCPHDGKDTCFHLSCWITELEETWVLFGFESIMLFYTYGVMYVKGAAVAL